MLSLHATQEYAGFMKLMMFGNCGLLLCAERVYNFKIGIGKQYKKHCLEPRPFYPDVFQEIVPVVAGMGQMGKTCFSLCSCSWETLKRGNYLCISTVQHMCSKSTFLGTDLTTFKHHQMLMCMCSMLNGDREEAVAPGHRVIV